MRLWAALAVSLTKAAMASSMGATHARRLDPPLYPDNRPATMQTLGTG
jgi:hypothetical protein